MKHARFWSFAVLLGVTVVAALAWLAPTAHGQTKQRSVIVAEPEVEALIEKDVAGPEARHVQVLLGNRGSRIGVSIRDLGDTDVSAGKSGVLIEDVTDDSPAAKAGIKDGDIVTSFDGERVRSARQFARLVEETPSGRNVKAQVLRGGSTVDIAVTPMAEERHGALMRSPGRIVVPDVPAFKWDAGDFSELGREFEPGNFDVRVWARPGRLGVSVQGLTPELAEYFGVKEGVLVTSVTKESAASKAGVKAGDVITSVDGKPVDDAGELRRHLGSDQDKATEVTLGVTRDRKPMSMKVPLEAPKKAETPKAKRTV
jgi:serine protease Do